MRTWQRRIGMVAAGLVAVVVLALGGVYGLSASAVGTGHAVESHAFDASAGDATDGRRLAELYGCMECHGPDLGGQLLIDGMPFARVPASNLTAGRPGGALSDVQIEQGIRHGVGADGRALFVMPSQDMIYLGDDDVADIIAHIRTIPAVQRDLPARAFGPVGRALIALRKIPFQPELIARDPDARHLTKPAATEALEYGHYLTRLCTGCHGLELAGAPPMDPSMPPGANLRERIAAYTLEEFRTFFTTGRTPEGREIDPAFMPWNVIGTARPDEIDAVYRYLTEVAAQQ
jgi:mono/diheme cytochrome c family protein